MTTPRLRICLAYDCLYPWTIGGAERWYRALAEGAAAAGHDVTYLTLRQWSPGDPPRIRGVRVLSVGPAARPSTRGTRRIWAAVRFGVGVFRHLALHGRRYDVVHTASLPFAALLGAALARIGWRFALVADWWEVWSGATWRRYLGAVGGTIGVAAQRLCALVPHHARTPTAIQAHRLVELGHRGRITVDPAIWAGATSSTVPVLAPDPIVVYVGRHVPDKRIESIPAALALARQRRPDLRAVIAGDGPSRPRVAEAADRWGVGAAVALPGFLDEPALDATLRRAACLVLPSRREGFGLAVLDAASRGVPSVVVRGTDNAASLLIEPGINGVVVDGAAPSQLADAIARIFQEGPDLRRSTADWWAANAARYSAANGIERVLAAYADLAAERRPRRRR